MGSHLTANFIEVVAVILFGIGFTDLFLHKNLIKKIIGLNIMDTAVYLFLAVKGYIKGLKAPIIVDGVQSVEAYINPVPSGLGADGDRGVGVGDGADAGADYLPVSEIPHAGPG